MRTVQVIGEVASSQSKLSRVITSSEAEWSQLSHIIQQDRQARVLIPLPPEQVEPTTIKLPCMSYTTGLAYKSLNATVSMPPDCMAMDLLAQHHHGQDMSHSIFREEGRKDKVIIFTFAQLSCMAMGASSAMSTDWSHACS